MTEKKARIDVRTNKERLLVRDVVAIPCGVTDE